MAAHLFPQFLDRDISRRFGCRGGSAQGFEELKRHPWFRTIDWDTLDDMNFEPPFVPDVRVTRRYRSLLTELPHCLLIVKESEL